MAQRTQQKGCWFEFQFRPESERRTTFEADAWHLCGKQETEFQTGKPVSEWKQDAWFAASTPDLEGPLEDVLKTSNLLPVFSPRLKAALEEARIPGIQLLPVTILDSNANRVGDYFLANVLTAIPALDTELSVVKKTTLRQRDGTVKEWVSWISKTVLKASALTGHDIIKLPSYYYAVYVSPRFKRIFEEKRFTGLAFLPVELSD